MAAKSPHFEKLFFPAILERPTEAPGIVLEKRLFQKGLQSTAGTGAYNFSVTTSSRFR